MQFTELLTDAYLIQTTPFKDERGSFGRVFCAEEFKKFNLDTNIVQINQSESVEKGTLRGLHFQLQPMSEVKIIKCIKGSIYDVMIDLRPASKTYKKWVGFKLTADNHQLLYIPKGFAHGFLTLEKNSAIIYFVTQYYSKEYERGIRWNDPIFSISWPFEPAIISDRDKNHPDFNESLL